jgi:hypothetical protein
MNKKDNTDGKPLLDKVKEIARKYGVEVTDGADRGIRAIGILGGISGKYDMGTGSASANREQQRRAKAPPKILPERDT